VPEGLGAKRQHGRGRGRDWRSRQIRVTCRQVCL
jgi:hypothetical protein